MLKRRDGRLPDQRKNYVKRQRERYDELRKNQIQKKAAKKNRGEYGIS
jgi:hypothetical protein